MNILLIFLYLTELQIVVCNAGHPFLDDLLITWIGDRVKSAGMNGEFQG